MARKETDGNISARKKASAKNREFAVVAYSFLALFVGMMGYFIYFQVVLSEDFINNPYNKRQEIFQEKIVRGTIYSADKEILAETVTDADGKETRRYPYDNLFAHVVGYANHGKTGLESFANFNLLRSNISTPEKIAGELSAVKNPGDNVVTTLSVALQQTAFDAIGAFRGAVVVMEPKTGKILAMVSKPDYNPNTVSEDWALLTAEDNDKSQLLNRAMQGLYPPGSTFKILTTLEYIREHPADYESYQYNCTGDFASGNAKIHCYGGTRHGSVDLKSSFARSCNTSYASLGLTLDLNRFKSLCDEMLFNSALPIDLLYNKSSFVLSPNDADSAVMETSIGQGKTLVTPLHMALITSAIANDGVLMKPYVIDHIENANGSTVEQNKPAVFLQLITQEEAVILQDFMHAVVSDGTGKKLKDQIYDAYGKTGSAEYSTGADSSHSWFVGYAKMEGKEDIAVSVIVERSGSGSEYAVPIAKEIFEVYFQN